MSSVEFVEDDPLYKKLKSFLQVNSQTFLIDDYSNVFNDFRASLFDYEDAQAFRDEDGVARATERLIKIAKEFEVYRTYLLRQARLVSSSFCAGTMTDVDCVDFAENLYLMAPDAERLEQLSVSFQNELRAITSPVDIPKLKTLVDIYWPQIKALFRPS